jgi:hypothetical protein
MQQTMIRRLLAPFLAFLLALSPAHATLRVNQLHGFNVGGGCGPLELDWTDSDIDETNHTETNPSYNHTFTSLGAEDPSRVIVVISYWTVAAAVSNQPASVTVAGNSATVRVRDNISNFYHVSLWTAAVPTGTSGTVTVTGSGTTDANASYISVYRMVCGNLVPTDTDTVLEFSPDLIMGVTLPSGGASVAGVEIQGSSATEHLTWDALSEDIDTAVSAANNTISTAHSLSSGNANSTASGDLSFGIGVAAAFEPL